MPTHSTSSNERGFSYTGQPGWGHLRLDRPQAGNRVSLDMLVAMTELLQSESGRTGVILISAAGDDFCLGRERSEQTSPVTPFDAFRPVASFYRALSDFSGLLVSAVHGRAAGFGVGIALRTDICLAASDARYAEMGAVTARALKAQGAAMVYAAGRGGEQAPAMEAAGVDGFIFAGQDVLALLRELHTHLGVPTR